jgi:hypothetical protein
MYLQDEGGVRSNVTVNAGLRYELHVFSRRSRRTRTTSRRGSAWSGRSDHHAIR